MHPDKKHYKVMVFNHGFGANMIDMLKSTATSGETLYNLKRKAANAIGRMGQHDPEARDALIAMGCFKELLAQVNQVTCRDQVAYQVFIHQNLNPWFFPSFVKI